jgi:radical SAM protein with 4Fe4S-binding SPASM domain
MWFEIKKAFEALSHPGINTNIFKLLKNSVPYYLSSQMDVSCPVTIYFAINSICNLKCKMCDVGQRNINGSYYKTMSRDKNASIEIDVFKSIIDEVYKSKPNIAICATEPLLYPHLYEAIAYCAERGLHISVTTNGYLLPNKAVELVSAGLTELNVSIDSTSEIHNYLRGRKDSYERAVAGIKKVKSIAFKEGKDVKIVVNSVIMSANYHKISDYVNEVEKLPVDAINIVFQWFISADIATDHNNIFGHMYPVTESCANNNPLDVDIRLLHSQLDQVHKKPKVNILPYMSYDELVKFYKQPNMFLHEKTKCMISWFVVQVLADGSVIPYTRCYNVSLGNVNDTSLLNIWNGKNMKAWRSFIKKKKKLPACKRCELIY